MSKELIKVAKRLESLGLHREAKIIKSAILDDIVTEDSGITIWLAQVDYGDGAAETHYYFDSKEDAEAWKEYETSRDHSRSCYIEPVNVQKLKR